MASSLLTKTRYLTGLQCPGLLWLQLHEPERVPATDEVTQSIFDQGHEVGELAKKLFPGGIDVPPSDFMGNIRQTKALLEERKPVFEAGIMAGRLYARVDILSPAGDGEWDIFEVKSSTSVKDVHIDDIAFQRHCCMKNGLEIRNCNLVLINNKYVRNGDIDPEQLFTIHDVTEETRDAASGIEDRIEVISGVMNSNTCPEMLIGPHCTDPYECPVTECRAHLPEDSVFTLYWSGKKAWELYYGGVLGISEIPEDFKLNPKQLIQKNAVISGETYSNRQAIRDFLNTLVYPLYYLDFETIAPAIPLFDGSRPYQNIPFQYSLHVVQGESAEPVHHSYLHTGPGDPRPGLMAGLRSLLGESGSIIAYNKGFEEGCLREAAEAFPEYGEWVGGILERTIDLLTPFSSFHYYHPDQKGSASLKKVMPAITGTGYDDLNIADGMKASIDYLTTNYGNASEEEKNKVLSDLEKYCGRDTEGMIWIVDKLRELSTRLL